MSTNLTSEVVAKPQPALTLLRLRPDMPLLARWAAATGQAELRDDTGYLLHAALSATLGTLAPRPFATRQRQRDGDRELLGYTQAEVPALQRALQLPPSDAQAHEALRLADASMTALPTDWRSGERLSFEVRVAPVVRSRHARPGAVVEVDAAWHEMLAEDRLGDRRHAYGRWLARELGRDGAAALRSWSQEAFALAPVARRSQRRGEEAPGQGRGRSLARGLLPDLTARGELIVQDPDAFHTLLARGLGRHRAFGYGCLLLAPPGVLHRGA